MKIFLLDTLDKDKRGLPSKGRAAEARNLESLCFNHQLWQLQFLLGRIYLSKVSRIHPETSQLSPLSIHSTRVVAFHIAETNPEIEKENPN